jgi:hypothetical protein
MHDLARLMTVVGLAAVSVAGCGGGGVGNHPLPNTPGGSTVVVSGKITFDRVPFASTLGNGINPDAPIESPARQIVVEAVSVAGNAVLTSTVTNATGDYTVTVPSQTNVFVRARAQMVKSDAAPTWNFSVRNNANSDALYVLDGDSFNTGGANSTRNLRATTGWSGSSYTGTRAAAPFAILDTIYRAKELVLTASTTAAFPALDLYWSASNRPSASAFCPDTGDIGTSFYASGGTDECAVAGQLPAGIYILGELQAGDTDEFDQHVLAHEFGHYIEDKFSRSDSIGGSHGAGELLDLRVAFSEGWGNAYAAMSLNDPEYRDSFQGIDQDFGFNLEADLSGVNEPEGWYSEFSVGEILWDVFDGLGEAGDTVALGFGPIFAAMTGPQVSTDALTSIFSFATALRSANASAASGITALLTGEQIAGTDAFGAGELNDGGDAAELPIYRTIALNTPLTEVCSSATFGSTDSNKAGNRRFLTFVNNQTRTVTVQAAGATADPSSTTATDPDIYVLRTGAVVAFGNSETPNVEMTPATSLEAGTYIIEVYDFDIDLGGAQPRCMTVTITG